MLLVEWGSPYDPPQMILQLIYVLFPGLHRTSWAAAAPSTAPTSWRFACWIAVAAVGPAGPPGVALQVSGAPGVHRCTGGGGAEHQERTWEVVHGVFGVEEHRKVRCPSVLSFAHLGWRQAAWLEAIASIQRS